MKQSTPIRWLHRLALMIAVTLSSMATWGNGPNATPDERPLPQFLPDDIIEIVGATPVRDQIVKLDLGSFTTREAVDTCYRTNYEFKFRRPKGAIANYPASFCMKVSNTRDHDDQFSIHKIDGVVCDTLVLFYSDYSQSNFFFHEAKPGVLTQTRNEWINLTFEPGETEKTITMSYLNCPEYYTPRSEYLYQYIVMDFPVHCKLPNDFLILRIKNDDYQPIVLNETFKGSSYSPGIPLTDGVGKYMIGFITPQSPEEYWADGFFEIAPETHFELKRRLIDHEAHSVKGFDSNFLRDTTVIVPPLEEVGTVAQYCTFVYKVQDEDVAIDVMPWETNIRSTYTASIRDAKIAGVPGLYTPEYPDIQGNFGYWDGMGSYIRPRFESMRVSKQQYDRGETVVVTAKLANYVALDEFFMNNKWLEGLDITVDGGESFVGATPQYNAETHEITFTFPAPSTRKDGQYLAEIMLKNCLLPWPSMIFDANCEFYGRYDEDLEEYVFHDRYVVPDHWTQFNVSSKTAAPILTQSISIEGMPTANAIFVDGNQKPYTLSANIEPVNATFKGKWVIDNEDIAEITPNGSITVWGAGDVNITYVSDEAEYRAEQGMAKNDAVLKPTVTLHALEELPEITVEESMTQNRWDVDPYYQFIINSKDWTTCGDVKVRMTVYDELWNESTAIDLFTPGEGIIQRKIPFNAETFPMSHAYGYEGCRVDITVPMKNKDGVVYDAIASQTIYVTNAHNMEMGTLSNQVVYTKEQTATVNTPLEVHFVEPYKKLRIDIKSESEDHTYGSDNKNTYYTSWNLQYILDNYNTRWVEKTDSIPEWLTIERDPLDKEFYMLKINFNGEYETGHTYYTSVNVNNKKAVAQYSVLNPSLDGMDIGYYHSNGYGSGGAIGEWETDNTEHIKELQDALEALCANVTDENFKRVETMIAKRDYGSGIIYFKAKRSWGKCVAKYDDEEINLGEPSTYGDDSWIPDATYHIDYSFPQDGQQHVLEVSFPEIQLTKQFPFTCYPYPEDMKQYYYFKLRETGQKLDHFDSFKAFYTVKRYDEANDTTVIDTLSLVTPYVRDKYNQFSLLFKAEGKIDNIWFTDGGEQNLAFTKVGKYIDPMIRSSWVLPEYMDVYNSMLNVVILIDEKTGEPVTGADVRYCVPYYSYYELSYGLSHYKKNIDMVYVDSNGRIVNVEDTGRMVDEGNGVYTLRYGSFKEALGAYGSCLVEVSKPGYVPMVFDISKDDMTGNKTFYEQMEASMKRTLVLRRSDSENSCVLPYIGIGSKTNNVDYPMEYNSPQLNSIIRYNEEDDPYLYAYIPSDAPLTYKNMGPDIRLNADNMRYEIAGNRNRVYDSKTGKYYFSYDYAPMFDAADHNTPSLSNAATGFRYSWRIYKFKLQDFIPGQKREEGKELVKSKMWIKDITNNRVYNLPYFMNMSIDANEYAKDLDVTIPDTDVKNLMKKTTTAKGVDTGFLDKGFRNFDINVPGVLPFDLNLRRDKDYFYVRGVYSHSFLPDFGVSDRLQKIQDFDEFFNGLKGAINGEPAIASNPDLNWLATSSAFVGVRAFLEGRSGVNPVTHKLDIGISELGVKAEASGYYKGGFSTPIGGLGFSLSGELSTTVSLTSADTEDIIDAGMEPSWYSTEIYDINLATNVAFRVGLFGDIGFDAYIFGMKFGFYGTAGAQYQNLLKFKPYYRDPAKAVNIGSKFSLDARLQLYWWTKFLFWETKHTWNIFNKRLDYYLPNNMTNPILAADRSEQDAKTMLRTSVYRPYSKKRLASGTKMLIRKVDAEAMPYYLEQGNSIAFLNINSPKNPNDDKVQILTDGRRITLDTPDQSANANFSLHAASAGTNAIVAYERSRNAIDLEATAGTNDILNMKDMFGQTEIVASRNVNGSWVTETVSASDEDGSIGNISPRAAINAKGDAVVVWNQGTPRFSDLGEFRGIYGNLVMQRLGAEKLDTVMANNGRNTVNDYAVAMSPKGMPVVFASVVSSPVDAASGTPATSRLCTVNGEGTVSSIPGDGLNLNIIPVNDSIFVASALTTASADVTVKDPDHPGQTITQKKESKDLQLFKVHANGSIQPIGFLGLAGHSPIDIRLVPSLDSGGLDGMGVIWYESQEDASTGKYINTMYGARIAYTDDTLYPSCPKALYTLPTDNDMFSHFDGYMQGNRMTAAITVGDRETDGSVVIEECIDFTNSFRMVDAVAVNIVNDGLSPVNVTVVNEGYHPIDNVSVTVAGNETIVPVNIMPGMMATVTGYALATADLNGEVPLAVNASFANNVSHLRAKARRATAADRMLEENVVRATITIVATDMDIELIASSTNEDMSTNALVEVFNKSKVRLKNDYTVVVGVYKDAIGDSKLDGVYEERIPASQFYTNGGYDKSNIFAFHIPAQEKACNVFALVKVLDKNGNVVPDISSYDNKLPVTIYAQKVEDSQLPGDANNDGLVDASDATLIQKYFVGTADTINATNADANQDGIIDAKDAVWVVNHYVSNYSKAAKAVSYKRVKVVRKQLPTVAVNN